MTSVKTFTFAVVVLLLSPMAASAVSSTEVRSTVAEVLDGATFEWNVSNFPGFYYDIDDNIGTEEITLTITNRNLLDEDNGAIYITRTQAKDFDFDAPAGLESWGQFLTIGFIADEHFAGYIPGGYLARQSTDVNLLRDEHLSKVLINNAEERTLTTNSPLKLAQGYEIEIKTVDPNLGRVYIQLIKNGVVVDSAVIEPSKAGATTPDKTYVYKKDLGDTKKVVIIAVNFKNAFRGATADLATIDGIWQISDTTKDVTKDTKYGRMTIDEVTTDAIRMNNDGERMTLSRNRDILLMENIRIKTADQDVTAEDPLRFYIYKEITEQGTYEIGGAVHTVLDGEIHISNPLNFAGFFYNMDDNIGTEEITTTITRGNVLAEDTGVVYTTEAQIKDFNFQGWGTFYTMAFLGYPYFAGYIDDMTSTHILSEATTSNLLSSGLLSEILLDDSTSMVVASSEPVELSEGYSLRPRIGIDDKGILVELLHNGVEIDSMAILPPFTYVYSADLGTAKGVPIIAAHFLEPVSLGDRSYCKIDGLWQISDQPLEVWEGVVYDKMTVTTVDPSSMTIVMANEGNRITLSRNMDASLMGNIRIKTADQDSFWKDPLRFYIYQTVTVSGSEEAI